MTTDLLSQLVAQLLASAIALSDDPILRSVASSTVPDVHQVAHSQIEAMACTKPCGIRAFYVPYLGIFIDDDLDIVNNDYARSILLHELVHHWQSTLHKVADLGQCDAWKKREWEAYAIQDAYLEAAASPIRVRAGIVSSFQCE